jgi:hypothetical protein
LSLVLPPWRPPARTAPCSSHGGFQCQPMSSKAPPIMEVADTDAPMRASQLYRRSDHCRAPSGLIKDHRMPLDIRLPSLPFYDLNPINLTTECRWGCCLRHGLRSSSHRLICLQLELDATSAMMSRAPPVIVINQAARSRRVFRADLPSSIL